MLAHRWQPITGLEAEHLDIDFEEIDALHDQWVDLSPPPRGR